MSILAYVPSNKPFLNAQGRYIPYDDLVLILDCVSQAYRYLGTSVLWWRGQREGPDQGWTLKPKVWRNTLDDSPHQAQDEYDYVSQFSRSAPPLSPQWSLLDRPEQLMIMQHHGLPTRLLDWTRGILTALYFAVGGDSLSWWTPDRIRAENEPDGVLWGLDYNRLNKVSGFEGRLIEIHGTETRPLIDQAFSRPAETQERANDLPGVLAVLGKEIDPRVTAQQAVFTIHSSQSSLDSTDEFSRCIYQIKIAARYKPNLSQALAALGVSRTTLFPDLQNLARSLEHWTVRRRR